MKILARATNWVGDAIFCLPALRAVRSHWPNAEIHLLAVPDIADLYRDQSVADHVIAYDMAGRHRGWRGREHLSAELRDRRFDLAILFQNAFEAAWLVWRAGIPERVGYACDARSLLLTNAVPRPRRGAIPPHEQFSYLELLRGAGWLHTVTGETCIAVHVTKSAKQQAADLLVRVGARAHVVRIAMGAGAAYGSAKRWAPARFAELANRLMSRHDCEVILIGAASEAHVSRAIAASMARAPIDLTGKTTIADLPAVLSQCDLFVGNDSGPLHLAAGVGLPVVAVFGPTDPRGTAPVTPRRTIVQEKPFCSPCFLRRCPIDHRCMTRITPESVAAAAVAWLLERKPTCAVRGL